MTAPNPKADFQQAALDYHEFPVPGKLSITPTQQLVNQNDLALAYSPRLVDVIAALEPTFGAINLEHIKAPECFIVERKLRARMEIPVFHDDQHGTAIIVNAADLNDLKVVRKDLKHVKLVVSGAGAAALACIELLVELGLPRESVWLTDLAGVVYQGRTELMDPLKQRFAQPTASRHLNEVIGGADIFLGLSAGNVLKPEMVAAMAPCPLILALANPTPEILPSEVLALLRERLPELEVDGEMHGDSALDEATRHTILPDSTLHGSANLSCAPISTAPTSPTICANPPLARMSPLARFCWVALPRRTF